MDESTDCSLTQSLAQCWTDLSIDDLPGSVVTAAKRSLLDTLAAGIYGARSDVVERVVRALAITDGHGESVVWARAERTKPAEAALINGAAAHARELDDFGGCGHSGAVVVPAATALPWSATVTGTQLILAIAAGYDVAARVTAAAGGYRPQNDLGWHTTGTCGAFGAAAAAAVINDLPANQFAHALGIAGTYAGGTWAFLDDGAMTKRLHSGKAAETGVTAALLAGQGFTGPTGILESRRAGFLRLYGAGERRPDAITDGLGSTFGISQSGTKIYACCRGIHSSIDAVLQILSDQALTASDIDAVRVHGNEHTVIQFSKRDISTTLDAQFSMAHCVAVAAHTGGARVQWFEGDRLSDPAVRTLAERVSVLADDPESVQHGREPLVELITQNGERHTQRVDVASGAPEAPISERELANKAQGLVAPILGNNRYETLQKTIGALEALSDARTLIELTQAETN